MHTLHHRFTETRVFCEGEEPEVGISNFMNFERKITSDDAIAIYVPRAFQRIISNPHIRHYVGPAVRLVCRGRFHAMSDIRWRRSSFAGYDAFDVPCERSPHCYSDRIAL